MSRDVVFREDHNSKIPGEDKRVREITTYQLNEESQKEHNRDENPDPDVLNEGNENENPGEIFLEAEGSI